MAMSITFYLASLTSNVVMYGCNEHITNEIITRLSNSDMLEFHPMIPVALFAELEQDRLIGMARKKMDALLQQMANMIDYASGKTELRGFAPSLDSSIKGCLEIGNLKNGLQAFQRRIVAMIKHVDELEGGVLKPDNYGGISLNPTRQRGLRDAGSKIKDRLKHLVDESDDHIQKCETLVHNITLSSQMVRFLSSWA